MRCRLPALLSLALVAGCAGVPHPPSPTPLTQRPGLSGPLVEDQRVPDFASRNYEPFSRQDVVAIALREWRLFGQPVDDDPPETRPPPLASQKPERFPGLWERVGEYWWIGQDPGEREAAWTGKHDANGVVFRAGTDGAYAWSAAFISYVMRVAGANERFPYSPNHWTYVNAAASGTSPVLRAQDPRQYAPKLGDLVCFGRGHSAGMRFTDLPSRAFWPGHCSFVTDVAPGTISVVGGNVDDAVTLTHVPVTADGMLAGPDGTVADTRYPWFVVLQVIYDAEAEPAADE
ncbi:MAG: DUF2272 domain-containing protein [Janthinobacterium lividum]